MSKTEFKVQFPDDHREFRVWQENGIVCQSGRLDLPKTLANFGNTPEGRKEAGAYIDGFRTAIRLIKENK